MSEWVGNYKLYYEWYKTTQGVWIKWEMPLGKCLGWDEAISKAIAYFLDAKDLKFRNVYIKDGWGNRKNM